MSNSKYKILVLSTVRNASRKLPDSINIIINAFSETSTLHWRIVESDSNDSDGFN